jgi:acyl dehydratase
MLMTVRYLEDFAVGPTFASAHVAVDKDQITRFAAEFDPQPFHLDETAAQQTIFHGRAASGLQTASLTMRLLVESDLKPAGGFVGAGLDELQWPRPVRPGDELHVESEVLDVCASRSHPKHGLIKVRAATLNQHNEPVQIKIANLVVLCRPA